MTQARDDSIIASKSLASRRARFSHPSVRSTIQRLGSTTKPLTVRSERLTTLTLIRPASKAARWVSTAVGDVNTYGLFAEAFLRPPTAGGRAGLIVPTGIATDDSTKAFFPYVSETARLARVRSQLSTWRIG